MENQILKILYVQFTRIQGPFRSSVLRRRLRSRPGQLPSLRHHSGARRGIRGCECSRLRFDRGLQEGIREPKNPRGTCEKIKAVTGGDSAQGPMSVARMSSLCRQHQMEQPWSRSTFGKLTASTSKHSTNAKRNRAANRTSIDMPDSLPERTTHWQKQSLWPSSLAEPPCRWLDGGLALPN